MAAKKKATKKPAALPVFNSLRDLIKGYAKKTLSRRKHKLESNGSTFTIEVETGEKSHAGTAVMHTAFEMEVEDFALAAAEILKLPVT